MKPLLVILILVACALGYVAFTQEKPDTEEATSTVKAQDTIVPYWEEPLPDNLKLLDRDEQPRFNVVCERVNANSQNKIRFHITEEHGFLADAIRLEFWYRFYDEDSGEWIDTDSRVAHVARERLEANDTLTEETVLLPIEYRRLGIDLAATTSDEWQAEVVSWARAMQETGG